MERLTGERDRELKAIFEGPGYQVSEPPLKP